MNRAIRRSPLALAILALLYEEPMHPYRMQQLIKEREKHDVVNVRQRASLYQTIDRLLRDGLITIQETARSENRPERTVYRLTEMGREAAFTWLREMLATPAREYPEFPAAVSFMAMLKPDEALAQLEQRMASLEAEIIEIKRRQHLAEAIHLPRVVLLESEYMVAMRETELGWVRSIIEDLRTGRLDWSEQELRQFAADFTPPATLLEGRVR
jgi:DNA-binding PadR family transcriptional regulator